MNSIEIIYYKNGQKYQEIDYRTGQINKYFECNGGIYEKGKLIPLIKDDGFIEYVKDGIFKYFLINGKLERQILYSNGIEKK